MKKHLSHISSSFRQSSIALALIDLSAAALHFTTDPHCSAHLACRWKFAMCRSIRYDGYTFSSPQLRRRCISASNQRRRSRLHNKNTHTLNGHLAKTLCFLRKSTSLVSGTAILSQAIAGSWTYPWAAAAIGGLNGLPCTREWNGNGFDFLRLRAHGRKVDAPGLGGWRKEWAGDGNEKRWLEKAGVKYIRWTIYARMRQCSSVNYVR